MTEKRPLNDEERALTINAIERLDKEAFYQHYLLKYAELMCNEGLRANYLRQIDEWEQKKDAANRSHIITVATINDLKDQLNNGVKPKDPTLQEEEKTVDWHSRDSE